MLRFCEPGRHYVLGGDAQVLRIEATGPTTGRRVYACHQHVRDGGLLPVPAFIGHRDLPPAFASGEGA